MTITVSSFDAALKQLYSDKNVASTTLKNRPLLGTIGKSEGFGGRNQPIINAFGDGQGRSASFAKAQANISSAQISDFLLTRVSNYSIARVTGEAAEASKGDKVAFLSGMKTAIDGAMNVLANNLETQLFRSGTGTMAVVGTIATGAPFSSLTLSEQEDIVNFEVNQKLVFSDLDPGVTRSATALVVKAVNRSTGFIEFVETASGTIAANNCALNTAAVANGDFIYTEGDTTSTTSVASTSSTCISGLAAWVPAAAPSSGESFFGVDRSVDSRMYGQTLNGSSLALEDSLITGASMSARIGGAPDICFINHVQMRALISALGAKKEYGSVNATTHKGQVADIGYRSVAVQGDNGVVHIVAANKCQPEIGWMLEKSSWTLHTLGPATKFLMLDGQRILRTSSDDSYEVRLGFRGNCAVTKPMHNVHIQLPAV